MDAHLFAGVLDALTFNIFMPPAIRRSPSAFGPSGLCQAAIFFARAGEVEVVEGAVAGAAAVLGVHERGGLADRFCLLVATVAAGVDEVVAHDSGRHGRFLLVFGFGVCLKSSTGVPCDLSEWQM